MAFSAPTAAETHPASGAAKASMASRLIHCFGRTFGLATMFAPSFAGQLRARARFGCWNASVFDAAFVTPGDARRFAVHGRSMEGLMGNHPQEIAVIGSG